MHQAAIGHAESPKEVSEKTGRQVELSEELLNEAREQTGTFKRFETDLAVSLAGAITTAFTPNGGNDQQVDSRDRRTELEDRHDESGEFLGAHDGQLRGHAEEVNRHRDGAVARDPDDPCRSPDRAVDAIGEGAGKAAEKLDKAGTDLLTRVEQVSANLASGATNLEGATQGVKEAMNDLDVTIREAAELGKQGSSFVRGALGDARQVFGRLKSAAEELNSAGTSLERVGGRLSEAVDSVEEMTREQRLVVNAVRDATPNAMASVQRVLDLLQQTVQATATMMNQTRDSMATTSKTLGTTVAEITAGISEYSKMVAELHRRMDQELAKAVGSLDKGVVSLGGGH